MRELVLADWDHVGFAEEDVRRLMDRVRAAVLESAGVELVPEIVFVGDWAGWPWPAAEAQA